MPVKLALQGSYQVWNQRKKNSKCEAIVFRCMLIVLKISLEVLVCTLWKSYLNTETKWKKLQNTQQNKSKYLAGNRVVCSYTTHITGEEGESGNKGSLQKFAWTQGREKLLVHQLGFHSSLVKSIGWQNGGMERREEKFVAFWTMQIMAGTVRQISCAAVH